MFLRDKFFSGAVLFIALCIRLRCVHSGTSSDKSRIRVRLDDEDGFEASHEPQQLRFVGTVDPRYVSYTLDWWPPEQGCYSCDPPGWGHHANVLDLDLANEKLIALAGALGPSFLRIGGSLDKFVRYDFPTEGVYCHNNDNNNNNETKQAPCLTASRWDDLHEFANRIGAKIVFGLSYLQNDSDNGRWETPLAVQGLLRYSRQKNYTRQTTLYGVELGEESSRYTVGTEAFRNYVQSYKDCAQLLREVFVDTHSDESLRPLLMGPCPGMDWPKLATWFPAFLNATGTPTTNTESIVRDMTWTKQEEHRPPPLDVAVYHSYNQIEWKDHRFYLNTTIPSGALYNQTRSSPGDTGWQAVAMQGFVDRVVQTRRRTNNPLPLWLGETGPHNGGGGPGTISSTFASSFGYMDTLGRLARLGHAVVSRQTLVGGKYELLRCTTGGARLCDFEPLPDYWVALLWSRLMGTRVLEPPNWKRIHRIAADNGFVEPAEDWKTDLHLHVHCTRRRRTGSIAVAVSNRSSNHSYEIPTAQQWNDTLRIEYVLSAHNGTKGDDRFLATSLALNGRPLHVGERLPTRLPSLKGRRVVHRPGSNDWVIAPATLGFAVFPHANVAACAD